MPQGRRPPSNRPQPESADRVSALAQQALDAFREDMPKEYKELVKAFDGRGADIALLGHGRFHLAVNGGEASIQANQMKGGAGTGRGAAHPETIHAILNGESTPLEEFFRGNLIAQAPSQDLHRVYDYFVRFADAALRSDRLREVADRFAREFPPEHRYELD